LIGSPGSSGIRVTRAHYRMIGGSRLDPKVALPDGPK
jgi:hypothetical protein